MKHLYKYLIALVAITWGCNDSFLERFPLDSINEKTYWNSENDLKIYNNKLYHRAADQYKYLFMTGFTRSAWSSGYVGMFWDDCQSDNCAPSDSKLDSYARIAAGLHTVPSTSPAGGWIWDLLRHCNNFLDNYSKAKVSDAVKGYYAGEVRLFRAWFYFDKVKRYGDVPWAGQTVNIESDILYAKRTNRNDVMDSVLVDLNYATQNMSEAWYKNEPDRLNRWSALAIKSRICLYEGTYRKYRNIDGAEKYLQEAASAAEELINNGPYSLINTGHPESDYASVFTQVDLTRHSEVIFSRKYKTGVLGHRFKGYYGRKNGATLSLAEDFLCTDGKPIQLSSEYQGDATIEDFYKNRDPRMTQITIEPGTKGPFVGCSWGNKPAPRLPGQTGGGLITTTGFPFSKFFEIKDYKKGYGKEENDAPIIRLAEVMLNFAEAKAELGTISQADLDKSINKLRDRVAMPHLGLNPPMDPKYASEGISSLIVEIRRERRIELAVEGYRYDDLMRWKKGHYLNNRVLGMRLEDDQLTRYEKTYVKRIEIGGKKYIDVYQGAELGERVFDENKHYLFPIPLSAISQNPNLGQNPGW
ncbi:RagB/SusD family nutrient uptake outer membrane protein [Puteibacter caeruleilacunae]|nr:RagB/SusD family nutrient uptake outer membrane protein [Puteibacter caeruleilacunae]